MRSLQSKFLALTVGCVLLSALALGYVGFIYTHKLVNEDSAQFMNLFCEDKAEEINATLTSIEQSVNMIQDYTIEQYGELGKNGMDKDNTDVLVKKVQEVALHTVKNTEGSRGVYMRVNPELAGRIVKEVSKAVSLPVTVKFRKGFDADHINAPEFAQIMEENGAAAVAVHGRTRVQYYTGQADWDIIRDVKNAVSIPVIGNGDIFKGEDAVKMRDYTGCDGIMVARGAKGNPWIFREVKAALSGKPIPERPTEEEVISMLLRHAQLSVQYKGEKMGIREMRKHTAWYTTGMHGSSTLRNKVNQVETFDALQELLMR